MLTAILNLLGLARKDEWHTYRVTFLNAINGGCVVRLTCASAAKAREIVTRDHGARRILSVEE